MSRSFEYSVSFPSKDFHDDQLRDTHLTSPHLTITLIDFNPKWSLGKHPSQLAIFATVIGLNILKKEPAGLFLVLYTLFILITSLLHRRIVRWFIVSDLNIL